MEQINNLFDIDKIYNDITSDNKNNYKYEGYNLMFKDNFYYILGYQYTKLNYINNKINTCMFLILKVDTNLIINDILLYNNFKGSQKNCNRDLLNDNLKNTFINEKLSSKNIKIKDYKSSLCRHIYELLYGMSDFLLYSINNNIFNGFYTEKNIIKIGLFKIRISTETNLNSITNKFDNIIANLNSLKFDSNYNIINSNLLLYTFNNNKPIFNSIISSNTKELFYQNYLKSIYKKWNKENEVYSLNNLYSFSLFFPTSFYSFTVQLMTVYRKIYNRKALNKCLTNFQVVNGEALCIGFRS